MFYRLFRFKFRFQNDSKETASNWVCLYDYVIISFPWNMFFCVLSFSFNRVISMNNVCSRWRCSSYLISMTCSFLFLLSFLNGIFSYSTVLTVSIFTNPFTLVTVITLNFAWRVSVSFVYDLLYFKSETFIWVAYSNFLFYFLSFVLLLSFSLLSSMKIVFFYCYSHACNTMHHGCLRVMICPFKTYSLK